jgi:outer membrane receptor protein involved in Fe transport
VGKRGSCVYRFAKTAWFLAVITAGLVCSIPASAQNVGGRVSGRVTDQSGAVVPAAQIRARNVSTGTPNVTQSDSSGYYVLQLPVGVYMISAAHTGFRTVLQQNVTITVGGDVALDFSMQVASTQTVVQVKGQVSPLVTPTDSSVQTTVTNDLVSSVPVEVAGAMRNSQNFLNLTPGYQGNSFSANLNGGDGFDQEVLIDGSDESPVGFGTGNQAQMIVPSFAVQEFQVIGDNVDAQYGRTSTGAIKYVFKSGTNDFHGDAFEYNRNEAYDSRDFFAVNRGLDRQNEFGFELGGPIKRDKTFFYGYYDGFRYYDTNPATYYSLLTPAMKAGDFTAPGIPAIYDPATTTLNAQGVYTRQQFSCGGVLNMICPDRISHISGYFASLLPSPNLPGLTDNYIGTSSTVNNSDQFLVKIDHAFNDKSQLSASYSWETNPVTSDCTFGLDLCGNVDTDHGDRAIVNWNRSISSNKLNHLMIAYNLWYFFQRYGGQTSTTSGSNLNAQAGLGGGVATYGQAWITIGPYYVGSGGGPNTIAHSDGEIGDDFSWLSGSHQMQFGANYTLFNTIGLQLQYYPTGAFTFAPQETALPGNASTGFAAASYLLGNVDSATYGQEPSQAWVMPYYAAYGQDKWKLRHNLTLSYGVRWDYNSPITDRQDRIANFDPTLPNPGAGNLPGALEFAGSGAGRTGEAQFANSWYGGVGPRVGIAYAPSPSTVFRAAYGVMYDGNSGPAIFMNQQGYYAKATLSSLNGGVTPAFNWNSGAPLIPLGPDFSPTFANGASTSYMQLNGARLPMVENYNVGIQKQLRSGVVIDASYVGTQTHHMLEGTLDYNQLNPKYLALGSLLDDNIGSPAAQAAGIAVPYAGFTGTVAQALRPFPQYQNITLSSDPVGDATYNSLQVRAQQRLRHGISYLVSYTVSKDLTNAPGYGGGAFLGAAQNYYDLRAEKAVATWDVPQAFIAAYTYDLPLGRGKLVNFDNSLANKALGGWATSGIITLESGPPISPTTELSLPAIGPIRPNIVSDQPIYLDHSRASFDPATGTYLNINAFTPPPPFSFGDAPPQLPNVRAFGQRTWDIALMKKIPLSERFSLTLKGEFFNALNAVNFGPPVTDIDNPSFGKIVTTSVNPRTGQLSATVSW